MVRKDSKDNSFHEPWKIFAERYLYATSPSTPSDDDMKVIEEELKAFLKNTSKAKNDMNVLILECTIRYRELLAKYGIKTTLADLNEEMYKVNTYSIENRKVVDIKELNEKLIIANWVDMDLKQKFDIILGDFVLPNIMPEQRKNFLVNIKKHLAEDGMFITRACNHPKRPCTSQQIVEYYANKPLTQQYNNELWMDVFYSYAYDEKTHRVHNEEGYLKFKEAMKSYPKMKAWVKFFEEKMPIAKKTWIIFKEDEQEKELSKHFKIIRKSFSKDYKGWWYCPTYVMKLR